MKAELRAKVERAIEALIDLLDELDALDEDREPSLGAPEMYPCRNPEFIVDQTHWARGSPLDLEDEHDGRESVQHTFVNPA